jgi:hypothetical protein
VNDVKAKLRSRESHASAIQSRFARKNRLIKRMI